MRVKLSKGRQKELIKGFRLKGGYSWKGLADFLGIKEGRLKAYYYETSLLPKDIFDLLDEKGEYEKFTIAFFEDGWGRSKGGNNSRGNLKTPLSRAPDEKLAEFVGAVLGDGHLSSHKKKRGSRHVGTYQIVIAGDLEKEEDYHLNYLKPLVKEIFGLEAKEKLRNNTSRKERFLVLSSKEVVDLFFSMGLKSGNKIRNQSTIPEWIYEKEIFLKSCLRGLIDTDGSIHRMSNKNPASLRINFTNHNNALLEDVRKSFKILGYHPCKIINGRTFYLSRKEEIKKYIKEINFSNKKHKNRFLMFQESPIV